MVIARRPMGSAWCAPGGSWGGSAKAAQDQSWAAFSGAFYGDAAHRLLWSDGLGEAHREQPMLEVSVGGALVHTGPEVE